MMHAKDLSAELFINSSVANFVLLMALDMEHQYTMSGYHMRGCCPEVILIIWITI